MFKWFKTVWQMLFTRALPVHILVKQNILYMIGTFYSRRKIASLFVQDVTILACPQKPFI